MLSNFKDQLRRKIGKKEEISVYFIEYTKKVQAERRKK